MGTDIHLLVERRKVGGPWTPASKQELLDAGLEESPYGLMGSLDDRNYRLFSLLAGVRNGVGFEGSVTGDRIRPISPPKGLPDDLSVEGRDGDYLGDHSFSWLTLEELRSAMWNQKLRACGALREDRYKEWVEFVCPDPPANACGWASGGDIVTLDEREYRELADRGNLPPAREIYVSCWWVQDLEDSVSHFRDRIIPLLEALEVKFGAARLVFGFDS